MHPPLVFGGPVMFPTGGIWATAWAADQPGASGSPYLNTGTTDDGGHWEHYDDGYYWWYKEWDAEGNEVENKSGYHHMSGGSGFLLARGTIQDGKDETAPLAGLQGGRADHAVEPTGDMDGDGVADHLDRDMDGDGIPDDRDSDDNDNGIRDWEEEQEAKRLRRAGRKLFNEFWNGLSDIDRQQWREDYANGKLDMLQEHLDSKLNSMINSIIENGFGESADSNEGVITDENGEPLLLAELPFPFSKRKPRTGNDAVKKLIAERRAQAMHDEERYLLITTVMEKLADAADNRSHIESTYTEVSSLKPGRRQSAFPSSSASETVILLRQFLKTYPTLGGRIGRGVSITSPGATAYKWPTSVRINLPRHIFEAKDLGEPIGTLVHEMLHRGGHGFFGTGFGGHVGPEDPENVGEMIPPSGIGTVEDNVEALILWAQSWINVDSGLSLWEEILASAIE